MSKILTPKQVLEIRRRYRSGHVYRHGRDTGQKLAKEYGVSDSAISRIVRRHRWRSLRKRKAGAQQQPPAS